MRIDVIAPGYGSTLEELGAVRHYIQTLGHEARMPSDLLGEDLLCANSDAKRFEHTARALTAPDSQAVWAVRGGYGTARILPMLQDIAPPEQPKTVIGFSDITALHLFLTQEWGWQSLHAPVLKQLASGKVDAESSQVLTALTQPIIHDPLSPLNDAARQTGTVEAPVTGGNLALLQTSIGTFWQMDAQEKIVVIEEVDEAPYRIDRMLNHLQQADLLQTAKALVFGQMTTDPAMQEPIQKVLTRFAEATLLPVWQTLSFGHGSRNLPVWMGGMGRIADGAFVSNR